MRVLVVDDSATMRMYLSSLLTEMDHRPCQAADGRQALDLLEQAPSFHLALVDWDMPVMDGAEFVKAVRADPRFNSMKMIMVTARDTFEAVAQALANGADDFLMKPVDKDMLLEKFRVVGLY